MDEERLRALAEPQEEEGKARSYCCLQTLNSMQRKTQRCTEEEAMKTSWSTENSYLRHRLIHF